MSRERQIVGGSHIAWGLPPLVWPPFLVLQNAKLTFPCASFF